MATNIQIDRNKNENSGSVLKRFTRKVQESGVLPRVRSIRYEERVPSTNMRKFKKLKSMLKRTEREHQIKLGKIPEGRKRRR